MSSESFNVIQSEHLQVNGKTILNGESGNKGLPNVISKNVSYSADNDIRSGAMKVPAQSIITNITVIVTTQLTHSSGTTGTKVGTAADGAEIVAAVVDTIQTAAVNTAKGLGTSLNSALTTALQGNNAMTLVAGKAYVETDTELHITVDNSAGISAGAIQFVVEYIKL
jgi:hypothetical protein